MPSPTETSASRLLALLAHAERARIRRAALGMGLEALGWLLVAGTAVCLVAGLVRPTQGVRWTLLASLPAVVAWRVRGGAALRRRPPLQVAASLEEREPRWRGQLCPAVDLARYLPPGASAPLAELAHARALDLLHGADLSRLVGAHRPLPWQPLALGCTLACFATVASGGSLARWVRAAVPAWDPPPPPPTLLWVAPGDTTVGAGQPVMVRVGAAHAPWALLHLRRTGHMDSTWAMGGAARRQSVSSFQAVLSHPSGPYAYRIQVGDTLSPWFTVRQYGRLDLREAELSLTPPSYTGLPPRRVRGTVDQVEAVQGTRISVLLAFSNPLASCTGRWVWTPCTLSIEGPHAKGEFVVRQGGTVSFHATDLFAQSVSVGPWELRAIPDRPPTLEAFFPGVDTLIGGDMKVVVGCGASDDFGIGVVGVRFAWAEREETLVVARGRLGRAGRWTKEWDLRPLDLLPDDAVTYRFEVWDNDPAGPKVSTSRWFSLTFPSLERIVASVRERQQGLADSLSTLAGEAEYVRDTLVELASELAGAQSLEWGTKEDARAVVERQQALAQRLEAVAHELAALEKTAGEEDLFSVQVLEKVAQVQELLNRLDLPQLERALEDLQRALDAISPQDLQRALSQLLMRQEEILQNLDRALEMLKRLEAAQRLSTLARRAEALERAQRDLTALPPDTSQASREERLAEDLSQLVADGSRLARQLQEAAAPVAEMVSDALSRVQEAQAVEDLYASAQALRQGREARQTQLRALASLQRLSADLQAAETALAGVDLEKTLAALTQTERDVLDLASMLEHSQTHPSAPPPRALAEAFRAVRVEAERWAQGLGPAAAQVLGLMAATQQTLQRVASGKGTPGETAAASRALTHLAGALALLRRELESSGQGMGMDQLTSLAQAQGGLNQTCQVLMPRAGGLPTSVLASLAAQQQLIREHLARVQQQLAGRAQLAGELGAIGAEMEEIVEHLRSRGLDEQALARQQRVLTRLLDAQRSVRRQGLSARRLSQPAKEQAFKAGQGWPAPSPHVSDLIPPRQDDAYPSLFREAVESYFRALEAE